MRVLVACEYSGTVRDAFIAQGHDAMSCDILATERPGPHHEGDVREVLADDWDLIIAHPPCTYLSVTGNKWFYHPEDKDLPMESRRPHPRFPDRRRQQEEALAFFMLFANATAPRIAIENPVGIVSTRWRKPDQVIQPYQFGHKEPKKTCLWLRGLPLLRPTDEVEPEYHITASGKRVPRWFFYADKSKGQAHRAKIRSATFQGIANAMADQWGAPQPVQGELFLR